MELNILYKDSEIIVCVKPAGVLSEEGGMPELLKAQCGSSVFCVHRLDRAVGGLMVYAGNSAAAAALGKAMSGGRFKKEYLAAVQGRTEKSGVLKDLLFKDSRANKTYVVKRMRKGVKEAELSYEKLASAEDREQEISLLRVQLHTGRSHQIRVQFASRRLPLIGDVKYGSTYRDCPIALFSSALSFPHPGDGRMMSFSALPPQVFPWTVFGDALH